MNGKTYVTTPYNSRRFYFHFLEPNLQNVDTRLKTSRKAGLENFYLPGPISRSQLKLAPRSLLWVAGCSYSS